MGQQGPDLFSSDIGYIMRNEYKFLLSFGYHPEDVLGFFKNYFLDESSTKSEQNLFWLIMARMQVNYGNLLEEVKQNALKVIESEEDIKQWEEYVIIEKHVNTPVKLINEINMTDVVFNPDNPEEFSAQFVRRFDEVKNSNAINLLDQSNIPSLVKEYLNNDDFSKIEVFGEDAKKYLKKRKIIIQTLHSDIIDFEPQKKYFAKPNFFDPEWKIGDIYASLVKKENDKNQHLNEYYYDKYIMFEVVDINRKPISRIIPSLAAEVTVFIKPFMYLDDKLPNLKDIEELEYTYKSRINFGDTFERLGKFDESKQEIYGIFFYNSKRKLKKMDLIKIRDGSGTESEQEISGIGCGHIFVDRINITIAIHLKHLFENQKKQN